MAWLEQWSGKNCTISYNRRTPSRYVSRTLSVRKVSKSIDNLHSPCVHSGPLNVHSLVDSSYIKTSAAHILFNPLCNTRRGGGKAAQLPARKLVKREIQTRLRATMGSSSIVRGSCWITFHEKTEVQFNLQENSRTESENADEIGASQAGSTVGARTSLRVH